MEQSRKLRALAIELEQWIKKGDTIYSVVTTVSRSGLSRRAKFYVVVDGRIVPITYLIADALGETIKYDEVVLKGVGLDVCFDAVLRTGRLLYQESYYFKHQSI